MKKVKFLAVHYFSKTLHLNVCHGSEYASGLLKLFCRGCFTVIYAKMIIVFPPNLEFSPYSEVIHGTATFKLTKANKG